MTETDDDATPPELIDAHIAALGDWRGETLAQGAALDDPAGVFNASLTAGTRRAIDLREGDELDEDAFRRLVRAAAAHNAGR